MCVLQLVARDEDSGSNARVGYTVDRGDSLHQLSLDLNTGELSVAKALDREAVSQWISLYHNRYNCGLTLIQLSLFQL